MTAASPAMPSRSTKDTAPPCTPKPSTASALRRFIGAALRRWRHASAVLPAPSLNRRQLGNKYEALATAHLVRQGFRILERQFRTRAGEIDLIAMDGGTLCFIEVRAKRSGRFGTAAESITPRKQQRLLRTAVYYLHTHPQAQHLPMRFDVVALDASAEPDAPKITLIRNAFTSDGRYLY